MVKATFVNKKVAIIGGGHMGLALAEGLVEGGKILSSQLWIADPTLSKIKYLKKFNVKVTTNNSLAVSNADIIFIAVKPKIVNEVVREVKKLTKDKILVSVAAAFSIKDLKAITQRGQRIARIMPNLPVKYNKGVIGFFGENISKAEKSLLLGVLSSLGTVVKVKNEKELDIITLVSACGPAIVSSFIEMIVEYARKNKIAKETASQFVMQTFVGTLDYLNQAGISPPEFIKSVATKGGITETILKNLNKEFRGIFMQAMEKGRIKIKTLSK